MKTRFSRTRFCAPVVRHLVLLRNEEIHEVTVDLLNDCMCLGMDYDNPDAYVHIDEFVLLHKLAVPDNHYVVIDCTNVQRNFTIYDFMSGRVTLEEMISAYGRRNVFRGYGLPQGRLGEQIVVIDTCDAWDTLR